MNEIRADRKNKGKTRYDLIPSHLLESTANVFEFGSQKYERWNWLKGMPLSELIGCLKRHLAAMERGIDFDDETGESHAGHMIANLLMWEHYRITMPEMDDRPKALFDKGKHGIEKQESLDRNQEKGQQTVDSGEGHLWP